MKLRLALALIGSTFLFVSPTLADTWSFTTPSGDVGSNHHVYVETPSGALTIEAFGVKLSGGGTDHLFGKTSGPDETGLGIYRDPFGDNEISSNDFINLDMADLVAHGIFGGTLQIESVQVGESFNICVGSSDTALGACGATIVGTSASTATIYEHISWTASADVIGVTGVSHDVLIGTFAADRPSSTPEPASLLLLGSGLAGIGCKLRKLRG